MKLSELQDAIQFEISSTEAALGQMADLARQCAGREPSAHELVAYGAYVRDLYQGLENILVRIAKYYRVPVPDTANWHITLLTMFADPPAAGLPLLITTNLNDRILEYRGFRHVFNKRYSSHLDWPRLRPLVESAPPVFRDFHSIVQAHLQLLIDRQAAGG